MQRQYIGAMCVFLLAAGCAGGKRPDPVESANRLGELMREARKLNDDQRYPEAADKLLEASRLAPDDAEVHRLLGATYGKADDYDSAVRALERSRELDPGDFRTRGLLGIAYGRQRRFDLAEAELREVLRIVPDDVEAHGWMGMIGYESRNFSLCAESFDRYIERVDAKRENLVTDVERKRVREAHERARYCRSRMAAPTNP